MRSPEQFRADFIALTGNANGPFPWQWQLYQHLVAGEWDKVRSCNIPTGLGKTSVIHIWLLALDDARKRVPRRLVYVVNRRTVVDQSTDEARKLRDRLVSSRELTELRQRLL